MATVTTLRIGPDKQHLGQSVEVMLEVRTSTGRFTFPFIFEDQGSESANEMRARQELRTLLQEALQAL
jgi:hypothetical protein